MNVYCPAGITRAFGGVENGEAKHSDAPRVTANRNGNGLTPYDRALCSAIGAISTAVAVLEINNVITEVVKNIPANSQCGPMVPRLLTSDDETMFDTPVFSRAKLIGIMAAINTVLSQLIVL